MTKRVTLALILLVMLSLFGLLESSYITWNELNNIIPPCPSNSIFNCESVLQSKWASIGPIPISALGMLYYATIFIVSCAAFIVADWTKLAHRVLKLFTAFGFAFSLYLMGIMVFVIGSLCTYCVASAVTSTLLFLISWFVWESPKKHTEATA